MCGLVASFGAEAHEVGDVMQAALDAMAHRGPDGQGLVRLLGGRAWLGHRRLALVDVASGGQPIASEDGSVVAVVNGEIYDDAHLRRLLEDRGHVFRTRSDSELIVHLYEEYGDDCVTRLNGELAFVLFDQRVGRVLAGRDRFGVKPIHFGTLNGRLCIASELKALIRLGLPPRWDMAGVSRALAHQYLAPSQTLVAGVSAIPPGHILTARLGEAPRLQRYHGLLDEGGSGAAPREVDPRTAAAETLACLERAVRRRLRSEVPIGAYLSGGLDSTAVVALASRHRPALPTFGVSFDAAPWDEAALAESSARALGVAFERVTVTRRDLVDGLAEAVRFSEGLAINGQLVAKHRLARAARAAGVVAVLTGEGADEAYLGYPHLRLDLLGAAGGRGSDAIARGVMLPAPDGPSISLAGVAAMLGFEPTFLRAKAAFGVTLTGLMWPEARSPSSPLDGFSVARPGSDAVAPVERAALLWTRLALAGYILRTLGDGTEMAASLEGRPPFLDHELFEHAWSLPVGLRIDARGREKAVLRDALEGVVPEDVRRRDKHPFLAPPVLCGEAFDDARSLLLDALPGAPFLEPEAVRDWIDALARASETERAAADPVWTMMTTAGLLGRSLGLA